MSQADWLKSEMSWPSPPRCHWNALQAHMAKNNTPMTTKEARRRLEAGERRLVVAPTLLFTESGVLSLGPVVECICHGDAAYGDPQVAMRDDAPRSQCSGAGPLTL